jgi:nitrite reductase/ring-hydroxylating ferredoxin subunit
MLAVSFAGQPIVFVRGESGEVFALEDRCAHRQVPLSRGRIVGECIQCCYHGWVFSAQGAVVEPASQARAVSQTRGVRNYPVREAHGLIFVFPGASEASRVTPLPMLSEHGSSDFIAINFQRHIGCHYSFLHENLMDMSHQFLHRRWMGNFKPVPINFSVSDDHVGVRYGFSIEGGSLLLKALLPIILKLGMPRKTRGESPTSFDGLLEVTTAYPYQSAQLRLNESDRPLLNLWLSYVPIDGPQKRSAAIGVLMVRKPRFAWFAYLLRPLFQIVTEAIYREDASILEAEQAAYDQQGADRNQESLPFILALRRLLVRKATCSIPSQIGDPQP